MKFLADQMRELIKVACKTKSKEGRATNNKRQFVEAILLGISETTPQDGEQDNCQTPSQQACLCLLDMPVSTGTTKF